MATEVEKKAVDLGLLEEDDEFEEFPAEEWDGKQEDQGDVNVWEDNWDDDTVEDDFSVQLSTFSRKRAHSRSPPLRSPEPVAKKHCARASPPPPPSTSSRSSRSRGNSANNANGVSNGHDANGTNGHNASSQNGAEASSSRSTRSSRSGSRSRGRSENSQQQQQEEQPRTPTRSSARLRSSRKTELENQGMKMES